MTRAIAALTLSLFLMGCQTDGSGTVKPDLAVVPSHYKRCFQNVTIPKSSKQAKRFVRKLTRSNRKQTRCGRALIRWYNQQRANFAGS